MKEIINLDEILKDEEIAAPEIVVTETITEKEVLETEEVLEQPEITQDIKPEVIENSTVAPEPEVVPDVIISDAGYKKFDEQGNQIYSMIDRYGEDYVTKEYITNPAIGRDEEIKKLILTLVTPEKSAILIGKPGIGKTAIIEGLAYRIKNNDVPDALKGSHVINIKTASLLGTLPNGESKLQVLIDELRDIPRVILFIDEIHMLIGSTDESALDFANLFKESLGRGSIKVVGATTTEEYERYVLRDKAFTRRFQKIEILEPTREHTIEILMGTLPKIEKQTGAKLKYTNYIKSLIMGFFVDLTSEYKRVYGLAAMYPDVSLSILTQAFSNALFKNKTTVDILDVYNAIKNSKRIYPDSIVKELNEFRVKYADIANADRIMLPQVTLEEVQNAYDSF